MLVSSSNFCGFETRDVDAPWKSERWAKNDSLDN